MAKKMYFYLIESMKEKKKEKKCTQAHQYDSIQFITHNIS